MLVERVLDDFSLSLIDPVTQLVELRAHLGGTDTYWREVVVSGSSPLRVS